VPAGGEDIALSNYDSFFNELYEDTNGLNYTVKADLELVTVDPFPKREQFFYGNDISFKFKVRDRLSDKTVHAGTFGNVYLSLQHKYENRPLPFISAHEAASQYRSASGEPEGFLFKWSINPNAVQGEGSVSLSAQDADGNKIPIYQKDKKEEMTQSVNIGGDIKVDSREYNTQQPGTIDTAFVVDFAMSCKDKPLKDAQLRCTVSYDSGSGPTELLRLPVAINNDKGRYSVSWVTEHLASPTGEYVLQFYRETDRLRATEQKEFLEKKARKEGEEVSKAEVDLKPLFEIRVPHQVVKLGQLPVKPEFLSLLFLATAFGWIIFKITEILVK
jgi:hypothetical protein